ncbi:MAG: Tol-Pal system beta propeller repeat protein TolB [Holosporales bacterium]|jgi:TolB protein
MMSVARALIVFLLVVVAGASPAAAELQLDITQGRTERTPIAVPRFVASGGETDSIANNMTDVVVGNLERSALFEHVNPAAYVQEFRSANEVPRYGEWRQIGAQLLLLAQVRMATVNQVEVNFRLFDTLAQKQLLGLSYNTTPANWRRLAHLISDAVYKRITGEDGYFDSRVVYVERSGNPWRSTRRLAIMDQDGFNHRYLTDGRAMVLTPRFSPTSPTIIYFGYYNNLPRVYTLQVDTGRVAMLGDFPGMTFAPRFSPDGRKVVFSMAQNGNSDIYVMDLGSKVVDRLTSHPGIDTSPSFSPDGKRIVFNSDRSIGQQLYSMNSDGSDVKRISFGQGRYSAPVWSPRGDLIAFTKQLSGRFYTGVMRVDGTGERMLSQSYLDEGPTWSPNGRVIMFGREAQGDGKNIPRSRIYSVDLTGYNVREVPTPGNASDPAWSGLNPK